MAVECTHQNCSRRTNNEDGLCWQHTGRPTAATPAGGRVLELPPSAAADTTSMIQPIPYSDLERDFPATADRLLSRGYKPYVAEQLTTLQSWDGLVVVDPTTLGDASQRYRNLSGHGSGPGGSLELHTVDGESFEVDEDQEVWVAGAWRHDTTMAQRTTEAQVDRAYDILATSGYHGDSNTWGPRGEAIAHDLSTQYGRNPSPEAFMLAGLRMERSELQRSVDRSSAHNRSVADAVAATPKQPRRGDRIVMDFNGTRRIVELDSVRQGVGSGNTRDALEPFYMEDIRLDRDVIRGDAP